jgi:membrane protein DedA with SNARE-associated domain
VTRKVGASSALVEQHANLAAVPVFLLAASESLVVVGACIPGTAILPGLSAMIGMGHLPLWPVLIAAAPGANAGDAFPWWVGHRWRDRIAGLWPFHRYVHRLRRGDEARLYHPASDRTLRGCPGLRLSQRARDRHGGAVRPSELVLVARPGWD